MSISNNIKRLRKQKGLSQHNLADKMKVKQSLLARWETGTMPSLTSILKICSALEININELFD